MRAAAEKTLKEIAVETDRQTAQTRLPDLVFGKDQMCIGDIEGRAVGAARPVPNPLCYTPPTQLSPSPRHSRSVFPVSSRAPAGRRRQHRARVSSARTRTPGCGGSGGGGPARELQHSFPPLELARGRPGGVAILTQARKGDGGMVLGAGLLGAVRVWAEASGCLPAVVRFLLLRGHGQAALPGRPAGGLSWRLRGAPAQDGLNGEAGDAARRRTPLARIFLAAHPGFIRNRRKPRTPFRDGLSGKVVQAGRQEGGRGGEGSRGRGRRSWRGVPFALRTRGHRMAARGSLPSGLWVCPPSPSANAPSLPASWLGLRRCGGSAASFA